MKLSSNDENACYDNPSHYRIIVGELQYVTLTRFGICLSINEA